MNDRSNSHLLDRRSFSLLLTPLLSACLLFSLPNAPALAQASCVFYSDYNSELYMRFPSSNFISGGFAVYGDDACQGEPSSGLQTGPLGYVRAASQPAAAKTCADVHQREMDAHRDFTKYSSQEIWWCLDPITQATDNSGDPTSPGKSPERESGDRREADANVPATHTCQALVRTTNLKMTATYGLTSGIQCKRIGAAGIYDAAISSLGVIDAVDIFGYAEQGYQLCFPQAGAIIFLDAATSPRRVVRVNFNDSGGFTCAALDRAGTVVLVAPAALATPAANAANHTRQAIKPGTNDAPKNAIPLTSCTVTPSTTLRLRTAPWGRSLGLVWEGSTAMATARTRSWYQIRHLGRDGWIAAWLTSSEGNCASAGPGHAARPGIGLASRFTALITGA